MSRIPNCNQDTTTVYRGYNMLTNDSSNNTRVQRHPLESDIRLENTSSSTFHSCSVKPSRKNIIFHYELPRNSDNLLDRKIPDYLFP
ncbi:hypothetical protein WH47_01191 [Habropoda laboriosa]|uniref:Uncharacterized protein n=1 Tax=Habropoda laboriosa TaxID=597456 RepID=A0A0L7QZ78_9HYME|nr:hypothetical protein WH47_01191 [Habropoda laboriosa]